MPSQEPLFHFHHTAPREKGVRQASNAIMSDEPLERVLVHDFVDVLALAGCSLRFEGLRADDKTELKPGTVEESMHAGILSCKVYCGVVVDFDFSRNAAILSFGARGNVAVTFHGGPVEVVEQRTRETLGVALRSMAESCDSFYGCNSFYEFSVMLRRLCALVASERACVQSLVEGLFGKLRAPADFDVEVAPDKLERIPAAEATREVAMAAHRLVTELLGDEPRIVAPASGRREYKVLDCDGDEVGDGESIVLALLNSLHTTAKDDRARARAAERKIGNLRTALQDIGLVPGTEDF